MSAVLLKNFVDCATPLSPLSSRRSSFFFSPLLVRATSAATSFEDRDAPFVDHLAVPDGARRLYR
jgi:hypothetical protein